jgi:polyisoprenoid-binding protein YceI
MRLIAISTYLLFSFAQFAFAEAIDYDIVTDRSNIGFTYQFGPDTIQGQFPDYSSVISIDFDKASNSQVDVTLNTKTTKAGFVFATQAVRSKKILDANKYPTIKFISQSVKAEGTKAIIIGMVTVRGITKPLTLVAQLLRDPGTKSTERDDLRIRITGDINRHDFGASGYPNYVSDMLAIQIDARIKSK